MTALPETLARIMDSRLLDLHTAIPGIVKSYDAASQTVSVQPAVRRVVEALDDRSEDQIESLPELLSVPVAWPRAGGFFLHFPISAGDSVLIVFSETDINAWRATGREADPGLPDRHTVAGAVAIPGLYPRTGSNSDADGTHGRVGREGGPFVEFRPAEIRVGGSKALAEAAALDALFDAFLNAVPGTSDGGAALLASVRALLSVDTRWTNKATTITKGD